jgi:integrase
MKLTATTCRTQKLPAGKNEAIFFDDDIPGLGLRLRAGGSRILVFQYKLGSKQRRMKIGAVGALEFGAARDKAKEYYARVQLGEDPAGDKADAKAKAAETFEAAADLFLARQRAHLRPRSYVDVERHLLTHAKTLHQLQLAKIERRDIATVIATITKNSGAVTGNRVRTSLCTFFGWAMREGLLEANPVINTNRNKEHTRERVLSPAELRLIWNALGDDDFGAIMKLLALTGQRAGEIAGLRWSEVRDLELVLPGERTKNHRAHTIPLSEPARAILATIGARPRRADAAGKLRDLVFGIGDGPFSGWSNSKEALDARLAEMNGSPLGHWTPHDLRRSFATHAAEFIGMQPHIIEACLNHVSGHRAGVAGIYNRAMYEPEKRAALTRWAEHLLAWVEGRESNVIPLRREQA